MPSDIVCMEIFTVCHFHGFAVNATTVKIKFMTISLCEMTSTTSSTMTSTLTISSCIHGLPYICNPPAGETVNCKRETILCGSASKPYSKLDIAGA